ncbi:MAG: hypothetical protein QXT63_07775 [Thermoplasmata archaeon]
MKGESEEVKGNSKGMVKYIGIGLVALLFVSVPLVYLMTNNGLEGSKNKEKREDIFLLIVGVNEKKVSLSEIEKMESIEGETSFQNQFGNWRGLGKYKGVELRRLAELVGGMEAGYVMSIEAKDGYMFNFSYYQVYANDEYLQIQGKIILAYEYNGSKVPAWKDGPMVAVLSPDGGFSNEDMNKTMPRDEGFASVKAAGAFFVKEVYRITIKKVYDEWFVNLTSADGKVSKLTRTEFCRLKYFNKGNFTIDGVSWEGASLRSIVGLVDDGDKYTFNESRADRYSIEMMATDGYNKTFSLKALVEKDAIIADRMNGSLIVGKFAPIRLVCPVLSKGDMIGAICEIKLKEDLGKEIVLTVKGEYVTNYTMEDIKNLPYYVGNGSFKKSTGTIMGPYTFKGVRVSTIISQMIGEDMNYSLEVESTDGYKMTFSSSQVNGTFAVYDENGNVKGLGNLVMLLAYEEIGASMTGGPLRIVLVGEGNPITDGHFWVKYVRYMRIKPYVHDWKLNLSGVRTIEMDRQTFESLASCEYHRVSYTFTNETGEHVYEGVPLWVLVSAIDGGDRADGHYIFNSILAKIGYNVSVIGKDGYNATFTSEQIARNNSIIVAYKVDGEDLPLNESPLKIVGNLSNKQKVKMISEIRICNLTIVPEWNLTLSGMRNVTIDSATFAALFYSSAYTVYYNYSETGTNHTYAGVPLWILVAIVDGLDDGFIFNDTFAQTNYEVRITSLDGKNVTLPILQIARNDSIMIAFTLDGEYLTEHATIKLVGEFLSEEYRLGDIAKIELVV